MCDDNVDYPIGSDPSWFSKYSKFRVDALSLEEWNYLRGLFLADGRARLKRWRRRERVDYLVEFYLGENETEIGVKVVGLLKRVGLNPWMARRSPLEHMLVVSVYSSSLFRFLPDKKALQQSVSARVRFLEESKLMDVRFGVPFVAGLFDGDGYCGCFVRKGGTLFGWVDRCKWAFTQRKYMFLVDYLVRFLELLGCRNVRLCEYDRGTVDVILRKVGINRLLDEGIGQYSWKVAQWSSKIAQAKSERMKYYTTGQAAKILAVSRQAVYRSVKASKILCIRGRASGRKGLSYHYIPVAEVKRLMQEPK